MFPLGAQNNQLDIMNCSICFLLLNANTIYSDSKLGIDGSARKPAPLPDIDYMVEKTYHHLAPYLGPLGAYLLPHWPI